MGNRILINDFLWVMELNVGIFLVLIMFCIGLFIIIIYNFYIIIYIFFEKGNMGSLKMVFVYNWFIVFVLLLFFNFLCIFFL